MSEQQNSAPPTRDEINAIVEQAVDSKIGKWKLAVTCFLCGFGAFLILGASWSDFRYFIIEKIYPHDVAYDELKKSLLKDSDVRKEIANDLWSLIGDHVDSGYSKTFYFVGNSSGELGQDLLQFYALPEQLVEITINAQSTSVSTFVLTVDNKNPFELEGEKNPTFPYQVARRDISKYLIFKNPAQLDADADLQQKLEYIHTVRIYPLGLPAKSQATFEVLVLVRNKAI